MPIFLFWQRFRSPSFSSQSPDRIRGIAMRFASETRSRQRRWWHAIAFWPSRESEIRILPFDDPKCRIVILHRMCIMPAEGRHNGESDGNFRRDGLSNENRKAILKRICKHNR
jgi:hypothetical protein